MENKSQTIVLSLKYVLLAILTGVLVGIIDTVFGRGLLTISDFRTGHYLYLIPFLPFAGLLITWLYYHFSETSLKGMTLVFETGQKKREDIPLLLIPLVMSGTWITHLFGGSAGREGVAVQIGAALSHALGRRFHLPKDSRVMLITGMAAGFGGLFQTPLTAVFFSMEVIVAGKIQYEALLPALIASYTAAYTSHTLGLEKFYVPLKDTLEISDAGMAVRIWCRPCGPDRHLWYHGGQGICPGRGAGSWNALRRCGCGGQAYPQWPWSAAHHAGGVFEAV